MTPCALTLVGRELVLNWDRGRDAGSSSWCSVNIRASSAELALLRRYWLQEPAIYYTCLSSMNHWEFTDISGWQWTTFHFSFIHEYPCVNCGTTISQWKSFQHRLCHETEVINIVIIVALDGVIIDDMSQQSKVKLSIWRKAQRPQHPLRCSSSLPASFSECDVRTDSTSSTVLLLTLAGQCNDATPSVWRCFTWRRK